MDRISSEKKFHDELFRSEDLKRKSTLKYYSIMDRALNFYIKTIAERCSEKRLLEYGCGTGSPETWEKKNAIVRGIDISSEGVKKANDKCLKKGLKAEYYVMNAEQTTFQDNSFDIIIGSGILHHLDIESTYSELSRILDPGGCGVFIEPLGHNPLLGLYRKMTPKMRTLDEHPLKVNDLKLAKQYFSNVSLFYFNLTTLFAVPFRNTKFFNRILRVLESIDDLIISHISYIRKYSWVIVMKLENPKGKL